jgi:hypothetical protein
VRFVAFVVEKGADYSLRSEYMTGPLLNDRALGGSVPIAAGSFVWAKQFVTEPSSRRK